MSQKISQLPSVIAANIQDTDVLPLVATNITSKATVSDIRVKILTQVPEVVTYSAAMAINTLVARQHNITVTNGVAFTVNAPSGAIPGVPQQTIFIKNTSGGVLGAVTWAAGYKLAGAWVSPATGFNRQITFSYEPVSGNWYEVSRSAADVPN